MDKAVKISIIAGALIVALSIAYYLVIFLPQKERVRVEKQTQIEETKKGCASEAIQKAKDDFKKKAEALKRNYLTAEYDKKEYDDYFNKCLREKGITN